MPSTSQDCIDLLTIVTNGLSACFPEARLDMQDALAALQRLVCWEKQRCYLNASPGQTLPGNLETIVAWDIEAPDNTAGMHTTSTPGDIQILESGIYAVSASVSYFTANATDQMILSLRKDLTALINASAAGAPSGAVPWVNLAWTGYLDPGTLQLYAKYRNGVGLGIGGYIPAFSYMYVERLVLGG